jgi:hypothetical protein
MSCSLSISGLKVGEGVISGVSVSTCTVGIGGAGLFACQKTRQLMSLHFASMKVKREGLSDRIWFQKTTERKRVKGMGC